MRNTASLAQIVTMVRAEAGHSLNAAQGQNTIDVIKALIVRTQVELWTAYQWPTLKVRADVPMVAGQYLYDFPLYTSFEQVRETWTARSNSMHWMPVAYGVNESMVAPGGFNSQKGDTPQFWDVEYTQFRVWPTPTSSAYTLRFVVQAILDTFVADSDMSTLDATAISLFTAAELLARAKAEDAPMKLQKAQKYTLALMGNSVSAKQRVSTLGSGAPSRSSLRATPYIDYIPN